MTRTRVLAAALALVVTLLGVSVYAQMTRPFHPGTVWSISLIRMKPGMETAYKNYVAGQWKAEQEAMKKEKMILSYKVLEAEAHNPQDWNLLLLTEYKDLATLEANEAKADMLEQKLVGDDEKQMQGYKDRSEIREIIGERLAREVVLESRRELASEKR